MTNQLLSADIAPETISSHFQEDWNTHSEEMAGGTRCVPADADPLMQQQCERIDVCTFFSDRATVHDPSLQANCDKWAALWTYMLGGQVHLSLEEAAARGVVGYRFGECEITYMILRRWGAAAAAAAVTSAAEGSAGILAGFMTGSVET